MGHLRDVRVADRRLIVNQWGSMRTNKVFDEKLRKY